MVVGGKEVNAAATVVFRLHLHRGEMMRGHPSFLALLRRASARDVFILWMIFSLLLLPFVIQRVFVFL